MLISVSGTTEVSELMRLSLKLASGMERRCVRMSEGPAENIWDQGTCGSKCTEKHADYRENVYISDCYMIILLKIIINICLIVC
jgi:hypothetical protein